MEIGHCDAGERVVALRHALLDEVADDDEQDQVEAAVANSARAVRRPASRTGSGRRRRPRERRCPCGMERRSTVRWTTTIWRRPSSNATSCDRRPTFVGIDLKLDRGRRSSAPPGRGRSRARARSPRSAWPSGLGSIVFSWRPSSQPRSSTSVACSRPARAVIENLARPSRPPRRDSAAFTWSRAARLEAAGVDFRLPEHVPRDRARESQRGHRAGRGATKAAAPCPTRSRCRFNVRYCGASATAHGLFGPSRSETCRGCSGFRRSLHRFEIASVGNSELDGRASRISTVCGVRRHFGAFTGGLAAAGGVARFLGREIPERSFLDLVTLSAASFKAARTIANDEVTSFAREPFVEGSAHGGERAGGDRRHPSGDRRTRDLQPLRWYVGSIRARRRPGRGAALRSPADVVPGCRCRGTTSSRLRSSAGRQATKLEHSTDERRAV